MTLKNTSGPYFGLLRVNVLTVISMHSQLLACKNCRHKSKLKVYNSQHHFRGM
jgi:hypothetical protein